VLKIERISRRYNRTHKSFGGTAQFANYGAS
jgi:hypothetical protein